jgi:hypothetical protein
MSGDNTAVDAKLNILSLALDLARMEHETATKKPKPVTVDTVLAIAKQLDEFTFKDVSVINLKKTRSRNSNSVL